MSFIYKSPLGNLKLDFSEKGLSGLYFREDAEAQGEGLRAGEMESRIILQLDEYFNKKREIFDLPLDLQGTEFQKRVWNELLKIPFGKTTSYKELTLKLGDIKAIRAVAAANGANPVSIIVPCHRVIGSDGSLTGYAGGLWRKKWLLEHESKDQILF
jgi:methylated-DNA-[protein]-cysteine S-methyltransferase